MRSIDYRYEVEEFSSSLKSNYLFVSEGQHKGSSVLKMIQYRYVYNFHKQRPVVNLGFGDYDAAVDDIIDDSITGNGDVYKIFNTVLYTMMLYFNNHPRHAILVRGSDGQEAYVAACRKTCTRNCGENCRKYNRRMKAYHAYVSKNLSLFEPEFEFMGGMLNENDWFDFEQFISRKLYDAIIVYRKNV
jgi:hypothetical protein